ncbi:MAG: tetratricopeptide repeat protein [Syntrophales bacterium]|nr:tetratricopeptide repeat protein [Syntrophales bacterium]
MKKLHRCLVIVPLLFVICFANYSYAKTMNILVLPFENTGNKEFSWISAGMTDTVITDLGQIKSISVVSNADRKKILEEMKFILSGLVEEDKMIKLGKLTGANVIFTGSYLVSKNRIRVHARLVNVETGKIESTTKLDGTVSDIFELQDKVVLNLMSETGKVKIADVKPVDLTEENKKAVENKPIPKADAYKWYAKGLELKDTNPKEALTNFKKALEIDPRYINALIDAGSVGSALGFFNEALGYVGMAERVLNESNKTNTSDYGRVMMGFAMVYLDKGQGDQALKYALKDKVIKDKLGLQNTTGYSSLMNNIGAIYVQKGQFDQALKYYQKAQSIEDALGLKNTTKYSSLMNNIGVIYFNKGQLDRALKYYLNAQSVLDTLDLQNTSLYTASLKNIGNIYFNKGQPDRALEYYLRTQSILETLGLQNTAEYANLMHNIGLVYCKNGPIDRAVESLLKEKVILDRLGLQNTESYAGVTNVLAQLYEHQGKRAMAGRYYRMTYDAFVKAGYSGQWRDKALHDAERLGY